jgi:hypothetical protein
VQKRDCLDVVSNDQAELVSCEGQHQEKVLDFLQMGPDTTLEKARDQATGACQRQIPPNDHGHDPNVYRASSWVGRSAWYSGTYFVICTAIPGDGGTMEETNHEEGVAMPGSTKIMGVLTVGGLVMVTAYTVALGSSGWLWFGWVVLGLITLAMVASRST